MATPMKPVDLGFVDDWTPYNFPNKVGGCPVWLRLKNLPNRSDILCKTCGKPLMFLLQVNEKIEEIESAFHRTLFLFICANGKCYKRTDNQNFAVFRSQLPQRNEFYSCDVNGKTSLVPSAEKYQPICCICGCAASLKCSKCPEADYCCEDHRDYDWKSHHQNVCGKNKANTNRKKTKSTNQFLLPELDLYLEREEDPCTESEKSDAEKMKEYSRFMQSNKAPKEMQDMPLDDLDVVMKRNDKAFNKFRKRIEPEKEQVLRLQRGGTPLWVSSEHVPSLKDIPDCVCGAKRIFEFQVMPQLLIHLNLDSLHDSVDWGTLAVYTCSKSCENGEEGYVKEFVWKQDFSDDYQ